MRSAIAAILALVAPVAFATDTISHGRFENVRIDRPDGEVQQVAIVLGEGADDAASSRITHVLLGDGVLVAQVDVPRFFEVLAADGDECEYPDGDLENLARHIEAYYQLPGYFPPILVGTGRGAAFAYAVLAQTPDRSYTGALSLGFCPQMELPKPLCTSGSLAYSKPKDGRAPLLPSKTLTGPWALVQRQADGACPLAKVQDFASRVKDSHLVLLRHGSAGAGGANPDWIPPFRAAFARIAATTPPRAPAPPPTLADLPITEVPATVPGKDRRFAVLLSGDGGWASIDKEIAEILAARGIPVAGIDSLRYFWSARTPEGLAKDLERVIGHYSAQWKKPEVMLVGYSQGADVLPFAYNRLPEATRRKVRSLTLLALSRQATFEFHLSNWIGDSGELDIAPEAAKLSGASTLCVYGEDEDDSLCPELPAANAQVVKLAGGHHFDGDYEALAQRILDAGGGP